MGRWEAMREQWAALARWRDDVAGELTRLPETLSQFREGVANFQVVGQRLADSTEALEQLNDFYSAGVSDRVRQLSDATAALQRQLAKARTTRPPGADLLEQAVEDFNRTVASLIELNPFLRSRRG
jgi:hypothetical protein